MNEKSRIKKIVVFAIGIMLLGSISGCSKEKQDDSQMIPVSNATESMIGSEIETPNVSGAGEKTEITEEVGEIKNTGNAEDNENGLKIIKIDSDNMELTDEQKLVLEYFDEDYLTSFDFEALRRYPKIFKDVRMCVAGVVIKVISMDEDEFKVLIWEGATLNYNENDWPVSDYLKDHYMLVTGKTGDELFVKDDVMQFYGKYEGIETITIDGVSYTVPKIDAHRTLQFSGAERWGEVWGLNSEKFSVSDLKKIGRAIFGDDIEFRKPIVGTDVSEEEALIWEHTGWANISEDTFLVVELENQSNAKFSRFLLDKQGGTIRDIKDALADYDSGFSRYFEFAPDFKHYFLFTYDGQLETLTLEYYDNSFNKIWKREFEQTTSAQYDYTKKNVYLTANNELYIINIDTGEDTYPPSYVGEKVLLRKLTDGILMVSANKSDGLIMANLDGTIKWKINLESDVQGSPELQLIDNRIVFSYWGNYNTCIAIDKESGEVLLSTRKEVMSQSTSEDDYNWNLASDNSEEEQTIPEYILHVNAPDGYVNLRTGPGTDYAVICPVYNGESFELYEGDYFATNGKKWLKVAYYTDNGWITGYVIASQVN